MADPQQGVYWFRVVAAERSTGWQVSLPPGRHLVGSSPGGRVSLQEPGVSRRHFEIEVLHDGGAVIRDLGSKNGTYLDGRRVREVAVGASAFLSFGAVRVRLEAMGPERVEAWLAPSPGAVSDRTRIVGKVRVGPLPPPLRTTSGLHPLERLGDVLLDVLPELTAGRLSPEEAAQSLVHAWLGALPLGRVELLRRGPGEGEGSAREVVVAAASTEGRIPASEAVRIEGVGGWILSLRPLETAGKHKLGRLAPLFRLALASLAARDEARIAPLADLRAVSGRSREKGGADGAGAAAEGAPEGLGAAMTSVYRKASRAARGDVPVVILGESGSGKELLARFVHQRSLRSRGPFLAVNCAALPKELLEAEIFGIERGVATGVEARPGLLERGHGGTVFLDEVGDMAPEIQAKVLRVLEQPTIYRVGGRNPVTVDVRFVAATNRDLEGMVASGEFRRDLYYRLAAFEVRLPPLRERREEIPGLAARFFHRELEKSGTPSPGLTRETLAALVRYPWPGNVRELQNEIAQAALQLHPGEALDLPHLSRRLRESDSPDGDGGLSLDQAVHRAERQAFEVALAAAGGDPGRAQELLGVSRATFYRKLKELGLAATG